MLFIGRSLKNYARFPMLLSQVRYNAWNIGRLRTRSSILTQMVRRRSSAQICVDKTECLHDEEVVVKVTGLSHKDRVSVVATTQQDELLFWSHGLFSASEDGEVDLSSDKPISGSYDEADPSGLLWSMTPAPWLPKGSRLFQAKAVKPVTYQFSAFPPSDTPSDFLTDNTAQLASVEHKRWYKGPHVRRVPIDHPRIRGTLFLPEGVGPFPGVIYMYGGIVPIVEGSAALLASHGFASLALSYIHGEGLPNTLNSIEMNYFDEVAEWFAYLPEVRSEGLGVLGSSIGGIAALWMAQAISNVSMKVSVLVGMGIGGLREVYLEVKDLQIKAVVNINGLPFVPDTWTHHRRRLRDTYAFDKTKFLYTDEGLVVKDVFVPDEDCYFKPWNYGSHLLTLLSGDDLVMNMNHNVRFYNELMPIDYRHNKAELEVYPGAGHLIELPYSPLCRSLEGALLFMQYVLQEDRNPYPSNRLLTGGYPKEHSAAQRNGWHRILHFFKTHLT